MHDIGTFIWAAVVIIGLIASQVKKARDAKPRPAATLPASAPAAAAAAAAEPVRPIVAPPPAPLLPDAPTLADIDRQFTFVRPVLPLGLATTDGTRRAVILMEILGPPVALR